ncbi:glutathione S-transferase [Xylaria sp. CBS 124048]|nr:glutathione S-transferase [Xylaria sp. CBS 124048]
MSSLKPIKVYGGTGPNPPKIIMILEELRLPYELSSLTISDVKKPEYLAVNPNGRMPAIYDPNSDLTLWESGAIVEYLVEKYDTDHRISFPTGSNASYLTKQWLYYQTTGQGPYYGQAVWFTVYHHEKLPSAIERYTKEIERVMSVVDGHLAKQKETTAGAEGPWLVGDKVTFADIAWYMWQTVANTVIGEEAINYAKYTNLKDWIERLGARDSVKKALALAVTERAKQAKQAQ